MNLEVKLACNKRTAKKLSKKLNRVTIYYPVGHQWFNYYTNWDGEIRKGKYGVHWCNAPDEVRFPKEKGVTQQELLERKVEQYLKDKWGSKYVPEENYQEGYAFACVYEDGEEHNDYVDDICFYGLYNGELVHHGEAPIVKNGYEEDLPYVIVIHFHKG